MQIIKQCHCPLKEEIYNVISEEYQDIELVIYVVDWQQKIKDTAIWKQLAFSLQYIKHLHLCVGVTRGEGM